MAKPRKPVQQDDAFNRADSATVIRMANTMVAAGCDTRNRVAVIRVLNAAGFVEGNVLALIDLAIAYATRHRT